MEDNAIRPGRRQGTEVMTTKTQEELRSDMVDALEDLDDADREGKVLSRQAIATLCAKVTKAFDAYEPLGYGLN
jgi:hypothetical protein